MRNGVVAAGLLALLLSSCADAVRPGGTSAASEHAAPPADLAGARAAWEQSAIDSYTLVVTVTGCMACGGDEPFVTSTTVIDGEIADRSLPPGLKPEGAPTVEDLFRWIAQEGPEGVRAIEYDAHGVPTTMRFDNPNWTDDEGDYVIDFEPLLSTDSSS